MTSTEGIFGGAAAYIASRTQSVDARSPASGAAPSSSAESTAGGASENVSISGFGQFLSSLEQLQTQSPDQFSQVVTQIASQVQDAADQQGASAQGSALKKLAANLQKVADTGDVSQLRHHHHGHHGGGATYGKGGQSDPSSATTSDDIQSLLANLADEVNATLDG